MKHILILVVALGVLVGCSSGSRSSSKSDKPKDGDTTVETSKSSESSDSKTSSKETDDKLKTATIWINEAVDITYEIPEKMSASRFNGSQSFSYLHGSSLLSKRS